MKLSAKLFAAALIMSHSVLLWKLFSLDFDIPNSSKITEIGDDDLATQSNHLPELKALSNKLDTIVHQMKVMNQTVASLHVDQIQHKTEAISDHSKSEPQYDENSMRHHLDETVYELTPINQILKDGVITQASLNELRATLSDVPESQHHAVMQKLIIAINEGSLVLEDGVFL